jgi:hypothetical protein
MDERTSKEMTKTELLTALARRREKRSEPAPKDVGRVEAHNLAVRRTNTRSIPVG